jgi:hypothetical protein
VRAMKGKAQEHMEHMEHNVPNVPHGSGAHGAHLPRGMCPVCSNAVCLLGFLLLTRRSLRDWFSQCQARVAASAQVGT